MSQVAPLEAFRSRHSESLDEADLLRAEIFELRARLRNAEQIADTDPLTGLVNRRCLLREIDRTSALVSRHDVTASLVFGDLNGLKAINDSYGHAAGDAALRHVAAMLAKNTRGGDLVGRIGGDEFAVLLSQADRDAAEAAAGRLADAITAIAPVAVGVTLRLGIAMGTTQIAPGDSAEAVLARADAAMYVAKAAQRSDR